MCCKRLALAAFLLGFIGISSSLSFKEQTLAKNIQLEASWIAKDAREMVDLIFVLDRSGSVSKKEFNQVKQFMRNFLEYFSVAVMHTQVAVVSFDDAAVVDIPLRYDEHKCNLMKQLANMPTFNFGMTNAQAGLKLAIEQVTKGRRNIGAKPVVVLMTDGDWNRGSDPITEVNILKKQLNALVMVIMIGDQIKRPQEMARWASIHQYTKKPMIYDLDSFDMFAHLAYYIHRGSHASKFIPVDRRECQPAVCDPKPVGDCVCDSLASRGEPSCGCTYGHTIVKKGSRYGCNQCPTGTYADEVFNVMHHCKDCPPGQTTLSRGSQNVKSCLCGKGFWNVLTKRKTPNNGQCTAIQCVEDKASDLTASFVSISGPACTYKYGSVCKYECRYGYRAAGEKMVRTCGESGQMEPRLPRCSAVMCPALTAAPNSQGWSCSSATIRTGLPFGTKCRSSCSSGYTPRAGTASEIMCSVSKDGKLGQWTANHLICDPKQCPVLRSLANGKYNSPRCTDSKLQRIAGTKCSVLCSKGFKASQNGVSWVCDKDGEWSNKATQITCNDVARPEFQNCPGGQSFENIKYEGYYAWKLPALKVKDNDQDSFIEQSVVIKQKGHTDQFFSCNERDCSQGFVYVGSPAQVTYTAVDWSGNSQTCSFSATVKDVEPPTVLQCDGPNTEKYGVISTPGTHADVKWKVPEFVDNSGAAFRVVSNEIPGEFAVGKTYNVTYTAIDSNNNKAMCSFSFKVIQDMKNCPPLHVPSNGYLVCDTMQFGFFCSPTCDKGYVRYSASGPSQLPNDYYCRGGVWTPHSAVGDCAVPVTNKENDKVLEYVVSDYCEDHISRRQIIDKLISEITDDVYRARTQAYLGSLTEAQLSQFHVFCGPKNQTIVALNTSN